MPYKEDLAELLMAEHPDAKAYENQIFVMADGRHILSRSDLIFTNEIKSEMDKLDVEWLWCDNGYVTALLVRSSPEEIDKLRVRINEGLFRTVDWFDAPGDRSKLALDYDLLNEREKAVFEKCCARSCHVCQSIANGNVIDPPATYIGAGQWVHHHPDGWNLPCSASYLRSAFAQETVVE